MVSISTIIFHIFVFFTIYAQVFLLVTFLENRKKIIIRRGTVKLSRYPSVTIIVPSFNEENTIYHTVNSLLNLNYPQDKVQILLVDDGSTDSTFSAMQQFAKYPNIKIFQKENGGKHTALNLGLGHTKTEFVGCFDADSVADPESLVRLMSYFEKDESTMAVTPSLIAHNPKTIVQNAQKMEYFMSVYSKKMLGLIGGIHVTPGPLTIFRRRVFEDLGPYRPGHNTEDMEIAYRMQKNNYKIEQCHDAYVYTSIPHSIKKLFRQRLRWIYGFINNTLDYKNVLFRKKYGNFSLFTLPAGIMSVFAVSYLCGRVAYNLGSFLWHKTLEYQTVGLSLPASVKNLDWFFINTQSSLFLLIIIYSLVIFSIVLGQRIANGKWGLSWHMIYFISIFSVIAPLWLLKAIFNTLISKRPSWR